MEEGSPDDVPGQVFHVCLILDKKTLTAEDLESGMTPVGEHGDQVSGNFPSDQEHLFHGHNAFSPVTVLPAYSDCIQSRVRIGESWNRSIFLDRIYHNVIAILN